MAPDAGVAEAPDAEAAAPDVGAPDGAAAPAQVLAEPEGAGCAGAAFLLLVLAGWSGLGEHLTLQRRRRGAQIVRAHGRQDRACKKNGFRSSHLWTPRPQRFDWWRAAAYHVADAMQQQVQQQLRLN